MSFNTTTLWSFANQASTGIAAHGVGMAVEITSMAILPRAWYKVPTSKVLHEISEGVVSSGTTINIQNEGSNIIDAMLKVTEPIWKYPVQTMFSMVSSYVFEAAAVSALGLAHCCSSHNHIHTHSTFTNLVVLGSVSSAGSYVGSWIYTETYVPLKGYLFGETPSIDETSA